MRFRAPRCIGLPGLIVSGLLTMGLALGLVVEAAAVAADAAPARVIGSDVHADRPIPGVLGRSGSRLASRRAVAALLDDEMPSFEASAHLANELKVGMWRPRAGGTIKLGSGRAIAVEQDLRLNDNEAVFNADLRLRRPNDWKIQISGFAFSTTQSGTFGAGNPTPTPASYGALNLMPGDPIFASLDIASVEVELGLTLGRPLVNRYLQPGDDSAGDGAAGATKPRRERGAILNRHGRPRTDLRIGPTAALRIVEVDQLVEQVSVGRERRSSTFAGLLVGLDVDLLYEPDEPMWVFQSLAIEGHLSAGPVLDFDGGFMWQVRVGLTGMISEHAGLMFGYRLLEINASDGDFDFDGGLQGLYFAGVFRF